MSNAPREGLYFFLAGEPTTQYLHAEVYYGDFSICQLDTEKGHFSVSFFNDPRLNSEQQVINIDADKFIAILGRAKAELVKFPNGLV